MDHAEDTVPLLLKRYVYCTVAKQWSRRGPHRKHRSSIVAYMLRALPSNDRCLASHCVATGLYATLLTKSLRKRLFQDLKFVWTLYIQRRSQCAVESSARSRFEPTRTTKRLRTQQQRRSSFSKTRQRNEGSSFNYYEKLYCIQ
jgi:hypothetical protein